MWQCPCGNRSTMPARRCPQTRSDRLGLYCRRLIRRLFSILQYDGGFLDLPLFHAACVSVYLCWLAAISIRPEAKSRSVTRSSRAFSVRLMRCLRTAPSRLLRAAVGAPSIWRSRLQVPTIRTSWFDGPGGCRGFSVVHRRHSQVASRLGGLLLVAVIPLVFAQFLGPRVPQAQRG
jgi:hypothetical protein